MKFKQFETINFWDEKPLYPTGKSIFACDECDSFNIENDAFNELKDGLPEMKAWYGSFRNYYLASRYAGKPEYNFIFRDFKCSNCDSEHSAFFYVQFDENHFPENEREFLLAHITGQVIEDNVDGIYNREDCQTMLQKFLIRWYILSDITYVAVPFIGYPRQKAEQRLVLLEQFLSFIHPKKTVWVTRSETLNQIKKDIDEDLGKGSYQMLDENNLIHPVIKNASKKRQFHAKFYCGMGVNKVEVLAGSHNIHGGQSYENLMFKEYTLDKFIERYVMQLGIAPIASGTYPEIEVLIFNRIEKPEVSSFTRNMKELLEEYIK